jgi:choline dehydrogenase-like flavoprotein
MHVDARTLEDETLVSADLCIVGAGAAGISMALALADSPFKVVLLEGGGFEVEAKLQELYKGACVGQRYYPLHSCRLHYFGGTTGHWAGYCTPFDEIDFRKRSWVEYSGWPIDYHNDLLPWYSRASKIIELESDRFDFGHWQQTDPELVKLPLDEKILRSKLWQFSPPTRFGKKYSRAIIQSPNIWLYTYANVTNIEANENTTEVTSITASNFSGKKMRVKAKYFVLAGGAMQNAVMLLSARDQAPNGLGNDNDTVGRFFMEHLEVVSGELLLAAPRPMKLYRKWKFGEVKVRAELGLTEQEQERSQVLNGTVLLTPREETGGSASIDSFPDDAKATVDTWDNMEQQFRKKRRPSPDDFMFSSFELFTRMEQAPNPNSRVMIDPRNKNELGMPSIVLDWKLRSIDKTSIRVMHQKIGLEVGKAGLGRLRMADWVVDGNDTQWPETLGGGWHHMGTTRMSESPEEGVVNGDCKVHNISNLYVAGSSCFATGGCANPTFTLVALSLRLAEYLKGQLDETTSLQQTLGVKHGS